MDYQVAGISSQRFAFLKNNTRKKSVFATNKISTLSVGKADENIKKPIYKDLDSSFPRNCALPMQLLIKRAAEPTENINAHENWLEKNATRKNNLKKKYSRWNRSQLTGFCVSESAITTFDDCYMTKVNVGNRVWKDADPDYVFPVSTRQSPGGNSHLTRSLVAIE